MSRIKSRGKVGGMGRLGPSSRGSEDMGKEECRGSRGSRMGSGTDDNCRGSISTSCRQGSLF